MNCYVSFHTNSVLTRASKIDPTLLQCTLYKLKCFMYVCAQEQRHAADMIDECIAAIKSNFHVF